MQLADWTSILKIISVALGLWVVIKMRRQLKNAPNMHELATKRFREASLIGDDKRLSIIGKDAEIVLVEAAGIDLETFTCTVYARNSYGEYFAFRASTNHQSTKHIEPNIAKIVLKEKFIAPTKNAE